MEADPGSRTSATLLRDLRGVSGNAATWDRFVSRYAPLVRGWCLRWGLQEEDAGDVTQEVLLKLVAKMRHFEYDPAHSFRGWLKTVARHALTDFLNDKARAIPGSGDGEVEEMLQTVEAREDLVARLAWIPMQGEPVNKST
jgi:RNA polymerase sigma-70 factor (ECF subfamily)